MSLNQDDDRFRRSRSPCTSVHVLPRLTRLPGVALAAWVLVAALALVSPAAAQWEPGPSRNLSATATVLTPLSGSALRHLSFGAVVPGDSSEVRAIDNGALNEGDAGKWEISFSGRVKSVTIAFVLPDSLVHTVNSSAKMPLVWNSINYGGLCEVDRNGACTGSTAVNPHLYRYGTSAYTYALANGATKQVYVYAGAKAKAVGKGQLAGDYTATVTLRFYTSNK